MKSLSEELATYLSQYLYKNNYIEKSCITNYCYLFEWIIDYIVHIIIIIIIGFLISKPFNAIIYSICTTVFRCYSGGLHAPNRYICLFLSYAEYLFVMFLSGLIRICNPHLWMLIIIFFSCIIVYFTPCSHNKYYSVQKKKRAKKRIIALMFLIILMSTIFIQKNLYSYFATTSICVIISAVDMSITHFSSRKDS